jgi:hypothetical protein
MLSSCPGGGLLDLRSGRVDRPDRRVRGGDLPRRDLRLVAVKDLGRCPVTVAVAVGACGAFVATASARTLAVRISAPSSLVAGACRVAVSVSRPIRATVLLQERDGRRWRTVVFDDVGVADLRAGRIDPRIVAVLSKLAEAHVITVGAMCSDHPKLTTGGAISQHYFGRGVDIARIDGEPVSSSSLTARDFVNGLSSLDAGYRPNEVGSPFLINAPGYFSDATTQDNIHIAFTQPIDPSWTPPAG